jgi:hypothetical protein
MNFTLLESPMQVTQEMSVVCQSEYIFWWRFVFLNWVLPNHASQTQTERIHHQGNTC